MIRSNSRISAIAGRRRLIQSLLGGLAARSLLGQASTGSRTSSEESFENDHLRAVHFRFPARARIGMHDVPASLMIYLTDSSARFANATGNIWDENVKAGEVRWWPGGRVSTEILSGHEIEFIQVVPK